MLLLLIGDAFHNFTDGVVIATAFVNSVPLGIAAVDLIPGLHRKAGPRHALAQVLLLLAGIGTIAIFAHHHG